MTAAELATRTNKAKEIYDSYLSSPTGGNSYPSSSTGGNSVLIVGGKCKAGPVTINASAPPHRHPSSGAGPEQAPATRAGPQRDVAATNTN